MDEVGVSVMVNCTGTNFRVLASSHSETLSSAMNITIAINADREIEITIGMHARALLCISQNGYYQIVTLISLF